MKYMTYRKLKEALEELTDDQLDMTVTVSAGCDENGNAEFFCGDALTLAMNPDVEAGACDVLEETQPIILFDE
jgi:hypothetical protein